MADIFISYAREDRDSAKALAKSLEAQGLSVWWDRNIPLGLPFDKVIRTELRAAECVVALWTKNAANSYYVIGEARDALRLKKLISVFLSISHDELPYDLQAIQGVELIDWRGDTTNADYKRLVRGITVIVDRSPKNKAHAAAELLVEENANKADAEARPRGNERQSKEHEQKVEEARCKLYEEPRVARMIKRSKGSQDKILEVMASMRKSRSQKGTETFPKTYTNSIGMEFILIPAGNFMMGSHASPKELARKYGDKSKLFKREHPQHSVNIKDPF
jgi:hypothetical protein